MNIKIILLILGMTAVTYIPRAIPAVFIDKIRFSDKASKFLRMIPYTAMTALIIPGVFTVDASHPEIGIAGAAVAGILAWRKCPLMVTVISAIAVDYILYIIINQGV